MCEFLKKFIVRSRFNKVMKEKGIQSQKELAERYDITTLFIIKLEEEQYNKISPARLSRLIYLVQRKLIFTFFFWFGINRI
ncbi:hypothetical protein RZ52_16555 [Bacillus velezensis]|nr:hypothetical protein RZ52_16555 [Bacillus velezensis]